MKEITVATSDLSDAKAGYEAHRYKWATIQAYYAMFHAARALIYSRGQVNTIIRFRHKLMALIMVNRFLGRKLDLTNTK